MDAEAHWRAAAVQAAMMSWHDGCSAGYAALAEHYNRLADEAAAAKAERAKEAKP